MINIKIPFYCYYVDNCISVEKKKLEKVHHAIDC